MKKRLLVAMAMIVPALPIMFNNKLIALYHILVLVISCMMAWEIFYMAKIHKDKNLRTVVATIIFMIIGYVVMVCGEPLITGFELEPLYKVMPYSQYFQIINNPFGAIEIVTMMIFALITTLIAINMFKVEGVSFKERGRAILTSVFAFIYVGIGFWHMSLIRLMPEGRYLILFILGCAWIGDTGGYVVGRKYGKHKMTNSASPNKSYEGMIGVYLFPLIFTALFIYLYKNGYLSLFLGKELISYSVLKMFVLCILFTTTGFLGDMGESLIKRMYNTKDSNKMFPGHGGVFDIFDSVILTAPIAYYIFILM